MAEKSGIEQQALSIWQNLNWQYQAGYIIKIGLIAAILLLICTIISHVFSVSYLYLLLLFSIVAGIVWWQGRKFFRISASGLTDYLNHRYQWLEFSTALIPILPEHPLQQLQRQRILQKLVAHRQEVKAWPDLKVALSTFAVVLVLYATIELINFNLTHSQSTHSIAKTALPVLPETLGVTLPKITNIQLEVKPPAYTKQASFFAKELSVEAPEGSGMFWKCQLSASATELQVIWNGKDTVTVKKSSDGAYQWQALIKNSLFYQIRYGVNDQWYTSPVYTIVAKDDQPPLITVKAPEPYTFVLYGQPPQVKVSVELNDEYGLQGAHLVATVSRGSGESVKFREEKLGFDQNVSGNREVHLQQLLDFATLKMEPGDELYFYTEAWDGASPLQKTRSDTYFVQWEDTTAQKLSVMAGISLDNMPAYFRSQRQIIIDTEKLLKEQKGLSKEAFKERSNNLGVDQKVLRLRYGQFLGEEFETGGGLSREETHAHEEAEEHEHEEAEQPLEGLHTHEEQPAPTVFGDAGDMLQEYSHRHDAEEAATLFDDALKAQLKAALAQMWEAELRLRTLRPKEALPYEYKALELIKAIQQKSRVYVERVGFEPPPLKPAEKRLTGELNEITNPKRVWEAKEQPIAYPAMREAVRILEQVKHQGSMQLTSKEVRTLEAAGVELGSIMLEQPGISVRVLNTLREIAGGQKLPSVQVAELQQILVKLLPKEPIKPGKGQRYTEPELDIFVQELSKK
jgi:hypothetical protein